jgi:hypothetical protein
MVLARVKEYVLVDTGKGVGVFSAPFTYLYL